MSTEVPVAVTGMPPRGGTFRALQSRNFRLFFGGQLVSQVGNWITLVAQTLLVLKLTGDGVAVGLLTAFQFGPVLLLGAWSGVLADRSDKRRLLIAVQIAAMAQSGVLAVLAFMGTPPVGAIYAVALVGGITIALDNPARRAFVVELVSEDDVPNGVALNSALMTGSRIVGPALAGLLITTVGYGWCFVVDAVSYLAVIGAFMMMRSSEIRRAPLVVRAKGQVREGLRYARSVPELWIPLVMTAVIGTFAFNFQVVVPLLVTETFDADDVAFTVLFSVLSLGSLLGALVAARRIDVGLRHVVMGAGAFGAALVVFAAMPGLVAAFPVAVAVGVASMLFMTSATALVQLRADPVIRGRVLALQAILFLGSTPIGGPLLGVVCEVFGARAGLLVGGVDRARRRRMGPDGVSPHRPGATGDGALRSVGVTEGATGTAGERGGGPASFGGAWGWGPSRGAEGASSTAGERGGGPASFGGAWGWGPTQGAEGASSTADLAVLEAIQRRVLWLAVRMVDHANRGPDAGGIKVGGHQASSASMVGIMTALWFGHLTGADKVAVKPHASPVFHAIKYLTGELDRSYLTRLRRFGGLQAYPSRTKDPDVFDFSTGSVGLGAVAPLFAAATRRYLDAHGLVGGGPSRFISLVGDAELDEGNVWEAIADPALQGLGNVALVVDLNRQSLDRVIPGLKALRLMRLFDDAGWHVVEAKYGRRLQQAFAEPGGEVLRRHIDDMSNEEYQSLFAHRGAELRARFLASADADVKAFCEPIPDDELGLLVHNLGGHDLDVLLECYRRCDEVTDRPSVVFAYTVKGWGLPIAGDPLNHAALLSPAQIDELRSSVGLAPDTEWDRFPADSPEGRQCASVGGEVNNVPVSPRPRVVVPPSVGGDLTRRPVSTQETFGRLLAALAEHPVVAERLVTTSPDVSVSTNLGGFINKMGVFAASDQPDWLGEGRLLQWHKGPSGHHIELGISEMNMFLLLGQLGLAHEHHGELLLPVGTVYDPFVCRGLDALIYSLYNGARFVVVGTPAGITLAPEGGAHQSTITASIGLELPGLTFCEPAYAGALDVVLCDAIARVAVDGAEGGSTYLRLSTRPLDQAPFAAARDRLGEDQLRADVLAGAYRLVEPRSGLEPRVVLAASGPVVPEVLAAAAALDDEGVAVTVLDITSLDRLYTGWREARRQAARAGRQSRSAFPLARLIPHEERRAPIVTVHDAASHAMAWLGSVFGAPVVPVGVDGFGQSGSIADLYGAFDLLPDSIVNAALVALDLRS